jgi:hypothetical protein
MTYHYPFNQCIDETDAEFLLRSAAWDRFMDTLYERARQALLAEQPVVLATRGKRKPKKAA